MRVRDGIRHFEIKQVAVHLTLQKDQERLRHLRVGIIERVVDVSAWTWGEQ
jgi:hypothetical protein